MSNEDSENAQTQSADQDAESKAGLNPSDDGNDQGVRPAFTTDSDGYYRSVKDEIDELLKNYPADETLKGAFSCSEWVRVKGEENAPEYLVGVIFDDGKAKYICYALSARDKENPPEEIRDCAAFVPVSALDENKGYFVIFQSATTGECIKPQKI